MSEKDEIHVVKVSDSYKTSMSNNQRYKTSANK